MQFVITRCYLVTVATPDLIPPIESLVFSTSRGLDLSATDILKAEIIGNIAPELRDAYTKKWEDAEEDLGRRRLVSCSATSAWFIARRNRRARC